jgi:long-chain fatty acid transport protein
MDMKVHRVSRLLLACTVLAAPATLSAQAFGLNEIGSCALSRGFAVSASPCKDASTIFWNPAGATGINGWSAIVGVASIAVDASFHQDTTRRVFNANPPTEYVPHAFVNYHKAGSDLAYGLGFYVPYGLTSQWPGDFPGRFIAEKASIKTFYIQPNIAWQINSHWSVGGGPIYGHSSVELRQALDLSTQPTSAGGPTFGMLGIASGTEFADAKIKGSASGFGAQIGILGKIDSSWSVGIRALSPITFTYDDADATFAQVQTGLVVGGTLQPPFSSGTPIDQLVAGQFTGNGALTAQKAKTKIKHPAQIQGGVAYSGFKNWLVEADYAWVNWKSFNTLPLTFSNPATPSENLIENYNNSSAFRIGAEYTIPTDGWKLRAGFAGVASAAPPETVTPLLPEQDRYYFNAGVGIPLGKTFAIDGSYAHVGTNGARGRVVERTATQTADQVNSGVFNLSANIFSVSFKATF